MAGRRLALLVAADTFEDTGLAALRAPQADVAALGAVLADAEIGGFEVEHVVNGTSSELRVAVNRLFARRDPDDFVLLHVSSHGLKDASGELYLATRDTHREQLDATSVEATYLRKQMDRSRAGAAVLLLDCCYGGAFERGMLPRADSSLDLSEAFVSDQPGRGRAVITASTALEYAFEGAELRADQSVDPSVFTEAVVSGLHQGAADTNGDGVVSLSEFFTYVSHRVRSRSAHQTPQWWLYGMSGELVIARNPSPVVTPRDLPADVVDVLAFPQAAARLGAVAALRELLRQDPGVALTAYRTLETLALDDSRQVSTAAAEALGQVHVTVEPRLLDFGRVSVGDEAPTLELVLGGTLAGTCTLTVRDAAVTVTRRGEHARVTLDTSTAAQVDGVIELVGPGGGVLVEVRGHVVAGSTRARGLGASRPVRRVPHRSQPPAPTRPVVATAATASFRWHQNGTGRSIWRPVIVAWFLALGFTVAGLLPQDLSSSETWQFSSTWFGEGLTVLPIVALPLVLVLLRYGRSDRFRLACVAAVGGIGIDTAVSAFTILTVSFHSSYVVVFIVSLATVAVSALLVRRLYPTVRIDSPPSKRLTIVLLVALVLGCAVFAMVQIVHAQAYFAPYAVGYGVTSVLLLLRQSAAARVVLGGVIVGLALATVLGLIGYVISTEVTQFRVDFLLAPVAATISLANLAPSWRALVGAFDEASRAS